jgi:hypothetical protein
MLATSAIFFGSVIGSDAAELISSPYPIRCDTTRNYPILGAFLIRFDPLRAAPAPDAQLDSVLVIPD